MPRSLATFSGIASFIPGFSNEVTLGETGEIRLNSRPVMHIGSSAPSKSCTVSSGAATPLAHFDGKQLDQPRRFL